MSRNTLCFFVSDLHGKKNRYENLFAEIEKDHPDLVLFGGDLLPPRNITFFEDYFAPLCLDLKEKLKDSYPRMLIILGNDDARCTEAKIMELQNEHIWEYINFKETQYKNYNFYGYCFVPPTPFQLKDWEKYDVSRFADPGCVHPNEGIYTVDIQEDVLLYSTIQDDLKLLVKDSDLSNSIFLFHSPPYNSFLDRAALDNVKFEHVPLDVHVGSIAIQRFIEEKQPLITLHGHIHESSRITGEWKQKFGRTWSFSAAYEGNTLSIIKFDPNNPEKAVRILI